MQVRNILPFCIELELCTSTCEVSRSENDPGHIFTLKSEGDRVRPVAICPGGLKEIMPMITGLIIYQKN
jgi:hypothetical protein